MRAFHGWVVRARVPRGTRACAFCDAGGVMKSCHCSILDVREEQIYEPSGTLEIRLICNICGRILEARSVPHAAGSPPDEGRHQSPGSQSVSMQF